MTKKNGMGIMNETMSFEGLIHVYQIWKCWISLAKYVFRYIKCDKLAYLDDNLK